jgi:Na+-driven multidrug efflux pump
MGLSRVAPTMVGQNLGAGQPDRAQRSADALGRAAALISVVVLGMLAALALPTLKLFSDDAETISAGAYMVRVLSVGYLAYSINFVYDAAQGGAGDTTSPMVINLVSLWAVQVPLAFLLPRLTSLDEKGVWLALNLGYILQLGLMWWRYRQGQWKEKRI